MHKIPPTRWKDLKQKQKILNFGLVLTQAKPRFLEEEEVERVGMAGPEGRPFELPFHY